MVASVQDRAADGKPFLRVGIETARLDAGGLETVVATLARGLPQFGLEPVIFCTQEGGRLASELAAEGIRVEVLRSHDRTTEMRTLLQDHRIQILNAHYSSLGSPVAHDLGIPVVATVHNAYAWVEAGVLDEFREADRYVASYIAVSRSVGEFTRRRFGIAPERLAVVRNGVEPRAQWRKTQERARLRAELGIEPDTELVVQIARIERLKCQSSLVGAMASLAESRPDLVAWIVGGVGEEDYAAQLRTRIADAGLESRVILTGPRDDVGTILQAADVFVQPSLLEGLSLSSTEAMMAGLPSVLTDVGDAEFLLGVEESEATATAGALVALEQIDPAAITGESLRILAEVDPPEHTERLAAGLVEVLSNLPARRHAARLRGEALRDELSVERMLAETASNLMETAAHAGTELSRERSRSLIEARAELSRTREYLEVLRSDVAVLVRQSADTRRLVDENLGLTRRTLDKLRLKHRVTTAWQAFVDKVRPTPADSAVGPALRSKLAGGARALRWMVIGVVPIDDSGGAQRSAQLARHLARRGHAVTYVARFPKNESTELATRDLPKNLEVLNWDLRALEAWLRARDESLRILVETPEEETIEFVRSARAIGARILYDKVDHWAECPWAPWFRAEHEAALLEMADDVVASATLLTDELAAGGREVHLVPNAYDEELFTTRESASLSVPSDLVCDAATLVYAGALWGEWFDWDLIRDLGRARADVAINLIGDPPDPKPSDLPANVHFLGLKPQVTLPSYYAAATACLIPFRESALVDAVSPLKLYEYLAMRRPVLATPMRELEAMPGVSTIHNAAEAIEALDGFVSTPFPHDAIDTFLSENSWSARVEALADITQGPRVSVIVLCYNNDDVIGACVDSLVAHCHTFEAEILVVDNGSTDGSVAILEEYERDGSIRLLRNQRNGCSSGRNLGIAASHGEFVVFLDSDQTVLSGGWLDPALDLLATDRRVGAVGWNGGWFRPGTARGTIVDDLPARGMSGRWAGEAFRFDLAYLATSGLAVPRAVLAQIAGFDEAYDPTCFEDTDLSFQIKEAGYELAYCSGLDLDHRPHATTGALDRYDELYARNERYFLEKWRERPGFFFDLPSDS